MEIRRSEELATGERFETRLTFVVHREDGAWRIVHALLRSGGNPDPDALAGPTGSPAGPLYR
jgi:hypothetical protein